MFNSSTHRRAAAPRSVRTDSVSTNGGMGSPQSLHSSPTFVSSTDSQLTSTSQAYHMNGLPQFTMAHMQTLVGTSSSSRPSQRVTRPWYTRRALSQVDLALEIESRAEGIEAAGLEMFEPRPRETIVSRSSSVGSVVLDNIHEIIRG